MALGTFWGSLWGGLGSLWGGFRVLLHPLSPPYRSRPRGQLALGQLVSPEVSTPCHLHALSVSPVSPVSPRVTCMPTLCPLCPAVSPCHSQPPVLGSLADPRKKIHFKVIRSPGDLLQFIEELKESTRKVGTAPAPQISLCLPQFPPEPLPAASGQGEGERGGGGSKSSPSTPRPHGAPQPRDPAWP